MTFFLGRGLVLASGGWLFVVAIVLSTVVADEPQETLDVFLPADRELKIQLDEAKAALDRGEFNDGVFALGELLAQSEKEDFFIDPASEGSAQQSLKSEARRLLAQLPAKGRDAYELQFGATARLNLQQAIQSGDFEQLTEVTRKYFHTDAGYEAALLLGRNHLVHGRPLAAAMSLRQLADAPPAATRKLEPELSLLLASSWLYAGEEENCTKTLLALRDRWPGERIRIGEKEIELFTDDTDALPWLRQALGTILRSGQGHEDQWLVYRGDASRNAKTQGGSPLVHIQWKIPTPNDRKEQDVIGVQLNEYVKQKIPAIPAVHPLIVRHPVFKQPGKYRDLVISRTPRRLIAADFHTGERIWFYPWEHESTTSGAFGESLPTARGPQTTVLKQRTWEDAPYGNLSTDGRQVYFIDDLGQVDKPTRQMIVQPGGFVRSNPDSPNSFNRLMALELSREGYQMWSVGGATGGNEPRLAGAFFLGPPLPLMGKLYALAEMRGDIRLVALDPASGKLQWQQQLCGVDNQAILDDSVRRLGGAMPSFADGVLVCPTSAGAVVAVDLSTRSLMWGYQYLKEPEDRRRIGGFWSVRDLRQKKPAPGNAWADASVTISGGKVIVTPVESDELFCLNLLDGEMLWTRKRDESLLVACVHDGNVILVGKNNLLALGLSDGKQHWEAVVPSEAVPSGRGFYSDHFYYLPLSSAEIAKYDLRGGKLMDVIASEGVLGNLMCYQDSVISQGATDLKKFHQLEALQKTVPDRLKANPDDAWALARSAELLLHTGDRTAALGQLRRAHEIDPQDSTKMLLVDTLLGALRDDFAANRQLAAEVDELIDRPDQRSEYLRLMALGLQKIGEHEQAFDFYLKIADQALNPTPWGRSSDEPAMESVDRHLRVREDRWVYGRIQQLMSQVEEKQRIRIDGEIRRRLETVIEQNSTASLRRFVSYFGAHPVGEHARLALARRLAGAGESLEAELILADLLRTAEPEIHPAAAAELATLLKTVGHVEEASHYYQQLLNRWPDVVCRDDQTGRQLFEQLDKESAVRQRIEQPVNWPEGRAELLTEGRTMRYSSYQRVYPVRLNDHNGPRPSGMRLVLDRQRRVILQDGLGRELVSVQLSGSETTRYYSSNYNLAHAVMNGHLLVLSLGYEVFAIDLLKAANHSGQRVLWRKNLSHSTDDSTRGRHAQPQLKSDPWGGHHYIAGNADGKVIASFSQVTHQGVCLRRLGQLVCLDPIHPDVVYWVRDGIADGAEVFGDEYVLLVVQADKTQATVISTIDGRELGQVEVGNPSGHWARLGRRIVQWQADGETVRVSMLDPWDVTHNAAGRMASWSHRFAAGSKGTLVGADEAAVLQPDGKFTLLSLSTGEVRFQTQLEKEPTLQSLHVLRGRDDYVVIANNPIADSPPGKNIQPAPGGYGPLGQHSPLVKGHVYALSADTGRPLWPVPAIVEHYGFPLDQPSQLPVLTFLRNVSPAGGAGARSWRTSVLCLDKRDGRVVLEKEDIPGQTQVYRLEGNPAEQSVILRLPDKTYTLKLTDLPRPPAPPAQIGLTASIGPTTAGEVATAITSGELDILRAGNGAAEALKPLLKLPDFNP